MVGLGGGNDTVTLIHYAETGYDAGGAGLLGPTITVVPGCRHRALVPVAARGGGEARAEKGAEIGVGVATGWWQTTIPINPYNTALTNAVLALTASDAIQCFGDTYQIIGDIHKFTDQSGNLKKVTILSERQSTAI